jgi:type IV pilus assembly protein PilA
VLSIVTDDAGQVTVKARGVGDALIDGQTITLTPYKTETTPIGNADVGIPVFKWVCAPGTMDPRFLPGSCRG